MIKKGVRVCLFSWNRWAEAFWSEMNIYISISRIWFRLEFLNDFICILIWYELNADLASINSPKWIFFRCVTCGRVEIFSKLYFGLFILGFFWFFACFLVCLVWSGLICFGSCYHSPRTVNTSVATIILISTEPEKRKNREYGQRKIKNKLKQ